MSFIELESLTSAELLELLDTAEQFLDGDRLIVPPQFQNSLEGKAVALLFFEPSTRTRVSFELAAKRLGAVCVQLGEVGSSLEKGETILDTCRNLEAMGVDAFVVRHNAREVPYILDQSLETPIINAGNGAGEHPSQGLLDALSLRRAIGDRDGMLVGKKVAIIGDIIHSRVARSNVHALTKLGAQVVLGGPPMMVPKSGAESWGGVEVVTSRRAALESADAVMVLRIQRERMDASMIDVDGYVREWCVDERVARDELATHAKIMHPGPVIRGVELTSEVADGARSLILDQVRCGVAVRQAILLSALAQ